MATTNLKPRQRLALEVYLGQKKGIAIADTGAKQSIASYTLYRVLKRQRQTLKKETISFILADGKANTSEVLTTTVNFTVMEKVVTTSLVVLPEAKHNHTLLGTNFLEDAGIILDMVGKGWYFRGKTERRFQFMPDPTTVIPKIEECDIDELHEMAQPPPSPLQSPLPTIPPLLSPLPTTPPQINDTD